MTKRIRIWLSYYATSAIVIIVLVAIWQIIITVIDVPRFLLPAPSAVLKELWEWRAELPNHILATMYETLGGFTLGILLGVPLAVGFVLSRLLRKAIYPLIVAMQTIPKIAIAPLLVIWLGFGVFPKVVMAFTMCFFPIVVITATGLMSVQTELLDLMKALSASEWQILMKIRFPTALPYFFSSLKVSITLAVVGAVIGEFISSDIGLGYMMIISIQYMNTARVFGVILLISVLSIVLFSLICLVEMFVAPWSKDQRTVL